MTRNSVFISTYILYIFSEPLADQHIINLGRLTVLSTMTICINTSYPVRKSEPPTRMDTCMDHIAWTRTVHLHLSKSNHDVLNTLNEQS